MTLSVSILLGIGLACSVALLFQDLWVIDPYMDEIFHIPQAQEYCKGRFDHWNPKITTFPGLYVISSLFHFLLSIIPSASICTPTFLRFTNFLCSLSIPYLADECRTQITGKRNSFELIPLLIYFYPITFFYSYLYYTDTFSIIFMLWTYLLVLKLKNNDSFFSKFFLLIVSCIFLLIRQTNVIWLLFFIGITIVKNLIARKRIRDDQFGLSGLLSFIYYIWNDKIMLLSLIWPLLLPVIGFVIFVAVNGSIVVGDKDNHVAGIHSAMVSHGIFLSALIFLPVTLDEIRQTTLPMKQYFMNTWKISQIKTITWITLTSVAFLVGIMMVYGSKSHPFLVSDNRHYTFYLWRRVLQHSHHRVKIGIIYFGLSFLYFLNLTRYHSPYWLLVYLIAVILVLIPTPLLEPRYFTQVVIISLLNHPAQDEEKRRSNLPIFQLLVIISFLLINILLLYIYVYKAFHWHDSSIARFMF